MRGYLVAQIKDHVRVDEPGQYFGSSGYVIDERPHVGPSITARDCCVSLSTGARWFHADDLKVLEEAAPDAQASAPGPTHTEHKE